MGLPASLTPRGRIGHGGAARFDGAPGLEPAPYSGKLRAIVAAGMHVRFLHWGGPCTGPGRQFTSLEEVDQAGIGPDVVLAQLMRRPCRTCGSRRWVVDILEPSPPPTFPHGGT